MILFEKHTYAIIVLKEAMKMENYNKKLGARIKKIREQLGLSQGFLAKEIGLDRSAVSQIETGKRKVSAEEIAELTRIFNISSDVLLGLDNDIDVFIEERQPKRDDDRKKLRISVPQKKLEKFKEVLLYILEKVGSKPNVGETVLYKLLYFIDFDFYEEYEEQLIGATYIKNRYGPTPKEFQKIIDKMGDDVEKVKSSYFTHPQTKYLPKREPDLTILKAHETKLIDDVLAKLSDMSAMEISEYSHGDVPWQVSKMGEIIDYESVFYRTPSYSVRMYDKE